MSQKRLKFIFSWGPFSGIYIALIRYNIFNIKEKFEDKSLSDFIIGM
jgi:hypothetical protein